ncbi:MAG: mechanosensitive ion channel family protein [Halolamina sp.]|uniref:mechanosensitive ion channel family protein n=1 Tax=Halolamina sp. TaxID=1940283 RepID=UPI002FC30F19
MHSLGPVASVPLQSDGSPESWLSALLTKWLPEWTNSPALSFLVLVLFGTLGYTVSRYVVRLLGRPIARRFRRQSVAQMVLRGARLLVTLFFLLIGAGLVGLRLGNIVLSVTVFSAVVGIVLAPLVGSVINGLFLLADEPYEIGDMVELPDGTRGFVDDITIRYTKIFTLENTFVVIPNDVIREQQVVNFSAEDERARLSLDVLVTYESDVATARALIEEAAAGAERVIRGGPDIRIGTARYPAGPSCYINEFGDNGVLLTLRYWVDHPYKLLTARSKVQTRIWDLLEERDVDVEMAYPHQHHVFDDTSGEAQVAVREATGDRASPVGSAALSGDDSGEQVADNDDEEAPADGEGEKESE